MRSVALDLGARKIAYCEIAGGEVAARATASSVQGLGHLLGPGTAPARVAVEACREAWHVHKLLTGWGHEVLLVDTTRVRQLGVGQHCRKTDRIDVEVLARAVERGAIPLAHVLSPERQQLRLELSVRRTLVETRARYTATVRGIARARGDQIPSCHVEQFRRRVGSAPLSPQTRLMIQPLILLIEQLEQQLAEVEARLQHLVMAEPLVTLLTTVPGVGLIVAAAFISVIDEAGRFHNAHQVAAYVGLVPSENSSGDRRRLGAVTKHGNSYLRSMLVQAAWSIFKRHDSDPLKLWAEAVAKRRGRRIAVVALARRLAGVLWAMWRDQTAYDHQLLGNRSATGLHRQAQDVAVRAAAMRYAAKKAHRRAGSIRLHKTSPEVTPS